MAAESVQCCVSSPPYWGLRDYGTATWEGGDDRCDHKQPAQFGKSGIFADGANRAQSTNGAMYATKKCSKCGAKRIDSQLGLESTPEEYVSKIVAVFREVRRVLRPDGTLWLNLGDVYAASSYGSGGGWAKQEKDDRYDSQKGKRSIFKDPGYKHGLKPKDLIGIPWMVAFALRSDGWWLRQDIIWAKPNPMPESVTDRCTKAHEYIFLLSKAAQYYCDMDSIREKTGNEAVMEGYGNKGSWGISNPIDKLVNPKDDIRCTHPLGRNKRSVWTVPTYSYPEAHFATYPPDLIRDCVLAGCPEGGTVLDPFSGAGTTGVVCEKWGRNYIGIELNPEYLEISRKRIDKTKAESALFT